MTKREFLRVLSKYGDDVEILINMCDPCVTEIDQYTLGLSVNEEETTVTFNGRGYKVNDICDHLPKSVLTEYPTRYECAKANAARYASIMGDNGNRVFLRDCAMLLGETLSDETIDWLIAHKHGTVYRRAQSVYECIMNNSGCYVQDVAKLLYDEEDKDLEKILLEWSSDPMDLFDYFYSDVDRNFAGFYTYLASCLCYWEILSFDVKEYVVGHVLPKDKECMKLYSVNGKKVTHPCGLVDENKKYIENCCKMLNIVYSDSLAKDIVRGRDDVIKELLNAEDIFYKLLYSGGCTRNEIQKACNDMLGTHIEGIIEACSDVNKVVDRLQSVLTGKVQQVGLYTYALACLYYWEILTVDTGAQAVGSITDTRGCTHVLYQNDSEQEELG